MTAKDQLPLPELQRETVISIGKKHFPKTRLSCAWFGFADDIARAALQALAQQAQEPVAYGEIIELLTDLEWSGFHHDERGEGQSFCPVCEHYRYLSGQQQEHARDCELNRILQVLRTTPQPQPTGATNEHAESMPKLQDSTIQANPSVLVEVPRLREGVSGELVTAQQAGEWFCGNCRVPVPAPKTVKCRTCNDHGLIGGHMQDGSSYAEPCQDCNAPQAGEVTDEREAFEKWYIEQCPDIVCESIGCRLFTHQGEAWQARAILALRPAAQPAVEPLLVRDLAEMTGSSVPEVCKAFIALGHPPHSTNMAVHPDDAVAVAKHLRQQAAPMALPQVEGDVLPPVGAKVLIHLASSDSWVEREVVGYYVWEAINDLAKPRHHRVFVRVRDSDGILNARHLCDVRSIPTHGVEGN